MRQVLGELVQGRDDPARGLARVLQHGLERGVAIAAGHRVRDPRVLVGRDPEQFRLAQVAVAQQPDPPVDDVQDVAQRGTAGQAEQFAPAAFQVPDVPVGVAVRRGGLQFADGVAVSSPLGRRGPLWSAGE